MAGSLQTSIGSSHQEERKMRHGRSGVVDEPVFGRTLERRLSWSGTVGGDITRGRGWQQQQQLESNNKLSPTTVIGGDGDHHAPLPHNHPPQLLGMSSSISVMPSMRSSLEALLSKLPPVTSRALSHTIPIQSLPSSSSDSPLMRSRSAPHPGIWRGEPPLSSLAVAQASTSSRDPPYLGPHAQTSSCNISDSTNSILETTLAAPNRSSSTSTAAALQAHFHHSSSSPPPLAPNTSSSTSTAAAHQPHFHHSSSPPLSANRLSCCSTSTAAAHQPHFYHSSSSPPRAPNRSSSTSTAAPHQQVQAPHFHHSSSSPPLAPPPLHHHHQSNTSSYVDSFVENLPDLGLQADLDNTYLDDIIGE